MSKANFNRAYTLKDWQKYYIDADPSFGHFIASILQTLYKNKCTSLTSLLGTIKNNHSILLSSEGTLDLIIKFKDILKVMPKFYINTTYSELNTQDYKYKTYQILSIKSDFILSLNNNNISGFKEDYNAAVKTTLDRIEWNNNQILINFLLKLMSLGDFFVSWKYLEKELFEGQVPYTGYLVNEIFTKFNIDEYSSFEKILHNANFFPETNQVLSNIKVINIPYTAYHADTYLSSGYQQIYRERFKLGKSEFNVKLIYLNADYFILKSQKSVYELLVDNIYYKYLTNEGHLSKEALLDMASYINDMDDGLSAAVPSEQTSRLPDTLSPFKETSNDELQKIDKMGKKDFILQILRKDGLSPREYDLLKRMDRDILQIKRTFVNTLKHLSNPFLSKIIDTVSLKLLKQYITTNFGEDLKENISDEVRALIEKKLISFIKSRECSFIEYYPDLIHIITEQTNEKEYLVEFVIINSSFFSNFCFKKYLPRARKFENKSFKEMIQLIAGDQIAFTESGKDDGMIIIPYLKIKEFAVYLLTEKINLNWEKLAHLFNDLMPNFSAKNHTAMYNNMKIIMSALSDGSYDIYMKDKSRVKDFHISVYDDIDYIFKGEEQKKIRAIIQELYWLHQKTSFGFTDKKDYDHLIELFHNRFSEYYYYKQKIEEYQKEHEKPSIFINFIRKLFFFIPKSLNEFYLQKIIAPNKEISRNTLYHYQYKPSTAKKTLPKRSIFSSDDDNIKNKIAGFLNLYESDDETDYIPAAELPKNPPVIPNPFKQNTLNLKNPPPRLEALNEMEGRLFNQLKTQLLKNRDAVFVKYSKMPDEKVVIHIKDIKNTSGNKNAISINLKSDISTIEEYSTSYTVIANLIKKNYLNQKEIKEGEKIICILSLSRSYHYFNKS